MHEVLLKLVRDKDYFVITTNVDHCFQEAGFDKKRLFYTQGDYGLFQCSKPCCQETFDNEAVIREMLGRQENMRAPAELIPTCPHCGRPLTLNVRDLSGVSVVEEISRMPKRGEIESLTRPSNSTFSVRS